MINLKYVLFISAVICVEELEIFYLELVLRIPLMKLPNTKWAVTKQFGALFSPIYERCPTVVHLAVHVEYGQRVYFTI